MVKLWKTPHRANEPRNHHYIPQCYLRGFGWKHKKQWYTNVAFGKTGEWHATNIRNLGAERDFQRRIETEMRVFNTVLQSLGRRDWSL